MAFSDQPESSVPFLAYADHNELSLPPTLKRRRKLVVTLGAVLSAVALVTLSTYRVVNREDEVDTVGPSYFPNHTQEIISYPAGVRGPPSDRFRGICLRSRLFYVTHRWLDNLLDDRQYITSWPAAGWSELCSFS